MPIVSSAPILAQPRGWLRWAAPAGVTLAAFAVYAASAAPGFTWAHEGADGGDLLAAAATNGVPHPPGYPLYIPLLQLWLALLEVVAKASDLAWRGNLLSAFCGALAVGLTALTAQHLARAWPRPWLWGGLAAAAFAVTPLLWSQSVITEVYALHVLLVAALGWLVLARGKADWLLIALVGLGVAHHLTFVLLLPAAWYGLWVQAGRGRAWLRTGACLAAGCVFGALFYLRIPLAAGHGPPPVNWGYGDNWSGFWWLVSAAAYRGYLFASPMGSLLGRIAAWALTITVQYTPVGLALALIGLSHWDRAEPWLRNFSLLWLVPVSIYSIAYYTRDSDIYLLPVIWLMAIWLAVGLAALAAWLAARRPQCATLSTSLAVAAAMALLLLAVWRWPSVALNHDSSAADYITALADVLEPGSILVTMEDKETFAAWYGTWGSGEILARKPGVIVLNSSLYQFDWYRRLQSALHSDLPGSGESVSAILAANQGIRPIYFAYQPADVPAANLIPAGPLWKLKTLPWQ